MELDKLFAEAKGGPIDYKGKSLVRMDSIELADKKTRWVLEILERNGDWRQGIILKTKGHFKIKNFEKVSNAIIFWEDTAPEIVEIEVFSKDLRLRIYNVWDVGNGTIHSWHNGAAMEIKYEKDKKMYYCNDGYPDLDLNDIIFSLSEKKNRILS